MAVPRPFALLSTADQWRRAAFQNTALEQNVVQLAWIDNSSVGSGGGVPPTGAGLDFDCECRLYHSVPEANRVERILWAAQNPLRPSAVPLQAVDLFGPGARIDFGEFQSVAPAAPLADPRGLCVDGLDRLFIAEHGARRILIYDLESDRLVRTVSLAGAPGCLAAHDLTVYAALENPTRLVQLDARRDPVIIPMPSTLSAPFRLAVAPDGTLWVLAGAGAATASVFPVDHPDQAFAVPYSTDLAFVDDPAGAILVLARMPGDDFLRYTVSDQGRDEMPPLTAAGYDGRGIRRAPDNRILYWSPMGLRYAIPARLKYLDTGRVTTFRLDSGDFYTTWGRVFIDGCIPQGTDLRISCVAMDEPPDGATLPRTPPANLGSMVILRPDLSPPMIPVSAIPATVQFPLYRRDTGPEQPWVRFAANDTFRTYEAPIQSDPGRYLWITVELTGNTRATPRLRAIRAEYPSHDYLRKLPKTYSRDQRAAVFLLKYLAMFEGDLGDWEARAITRRALIEAKSAPDEILPWLAAFVGLVLDERWSVSVRRQLIAQAIWLFRFRGTVPGLLRFLEICTQGSAVIVEKFRLRGSGGAVLGDATGLTSVIGVGFRIGGDVLDLSGDAIGGSTEDAFETHAHRFTVYIQQSLSQEQSDMVQHLLDVHRPAHTVVDFCTIGAGMRVGRGLLVGLTSMIGRSEGFTRFQMGSSVLGRGALLGRGQTGTITGASVLGRDSQVG
jgi:phage tail-like protein